MRIAWMLVGLMLAAAAVLGSPAAFSQETAATEDAAVHFQKGVELFDEGEFEAALAEFHWAYSMKPHFAVLYNIAQCYYATGRHEKALEYFDRYVGDGGDQIPKKRLDEVKASIAHLLEILTELQIDTKPSGAKVKLDGKVIGSTPFVEPVHAPAGPHTIEVSLPGYMVVQEDVILTGGQSFDRSYELTVDEREGTLTVTSPTPKARVFVDGREMGPVPWTGKLIVGEHVVTVKAPGYSDAIRPVVILAEDDRIVDVPLEVKGKPGKLTVESSVQGTIVLVDGIEQGQTPLGSIALPAGVYEVTTVKDGYAGWHGDVTIKEGLPAKVDVKMAGTEGKIRPAGFWVSTSLSLATLATAGVFGILAMGKQDELDSFLRAIATGSEGANEVKLTAKYNDLRNDGKRYALIADVFLGVGSAAAVTAIFLAFFTRFKTPTSEAQISVSPMTNGTQIGLVAGWRM